MSFELSSVLEGSELTWFVEHTLEAVYYNRCKRCWIYVEGRAFRSVSEARNLCGGSSFLLTNIVGMKLKRRELLIDTINWSNMANTRCTWFLFVRNVATNSLDLATSMENACMYVKRQLDDNQFVSLGRNGFYEGRLQIIQQQQRQQPQLTPHKVTISQPSGLRPLWVCQNPLFGSLLSQQRDRENASVERNKQNSDLIQTRYQQILSSLASERECSRVIGSR